MARHITQETFDAAVLENIELLEMSPEDAVLEAVQQFEAQVLTLFWIMVYSRISVSYTHLTLPTKRIV